MKSNNSAVEALAWYQAENSARKKTSVLAAINECLADNRDITVASVSRAAGVSRQFIHSHEELHEAVKQAEKQVREHRTRRLAEGSHVTQALRADRATLGSYIDRLKDKIAMQEERLVGYEKLRKRWLGSQLPGGERIDPEVHAELRVTNEKLMFENTFMLRENAELRRLMARLEGDLAASRQAHAEAVQTGPTDGTVIPIGMLKDRK